ncbi:ThiF family adenylyltransferase [Nitrosospira sp. NRS527]|uniref:ThiF family adenylyltransferase n=1 Tax=Nitrosospira sp. NRS527 TaxID=155925 RepID=UPI001AF1E162|nr:ThiF family adenylyltransferase [Nitrosospira sp. NRS527]BCT69155.1 hypothetical protein NNRS527_02769 [Nitrosospira sp. NRS527]
MNPLTALSLTAAHHLQLKAHLLPGDGLEAAAILLCTKVPGPRLRLLVKEWLPVPHAECSLRTAHSLTWPSSYIEDAIDKALMENLCLILVHSHPTGYPNFSEIDDKSDRSIIPSIFEAGGDCHGSAVMMPNGHMISRFYKNDGQVVTCDLVSVAGEDLHFWWFDDSKRTLDRPLAFTSAMQFELAKMSACVIGVSGTGSIVAEQLCRLGFGNVILIDHDHVEDKNLNRILNTVHADALNASSKVSVFASRANQYRAKDFVTEIHADALSRKAVLAASQADVIFSCVDTHRARSIADRIAVSFLLPLFDVGVAIPTRTITGGRAIDEVTGRIDYIQPGGSTLADREVYTPASLQAEALAEAAPDAHALQVRAGYIDDIPEQAPSVISLNMRAASACVMEFIARAFPFRHEPNDSYARTRFLLAECLEEYSAEISFPIKCQPNLARGGAEPLLGLPILSK